MGKYSYLAGDYVFETLLQKFIRKTYLGQLSGNILTTTGYVSNSSRSERTDTEDCSEFTFTKHERPRFLLSLVHGEEMAASEPSKAVLECLFPVTSPLLV